MDAIAKILRAMPRKDKEQVLATLLEIQAGTLTGIKLEGKQMYRVRVGNYRILYEVSSRGPVITAIRRRNEHTYDR